MNEVQLSPRITLLSAKVDGVGHSDRGRATPHRLSIMADDPADVVTAAGGLIFDRVSAGWDVRVFLTECTDRRPLRILGVDARDLSDGITSIDQWPEAIMVAADLYSHEVRLRRYVGTASREHRSEVAVWGGDWPATLDQGIGPVFHRLSAAARAFKVHAMAAAGVTPQVSATEHFRSGKRRFTIAAPLVRSS